MMKTMAMTKKRQMLTDVEIERLLADDIEWYWVDMEAPGTDEAALMAGVFKFHSLAIEDCFNDLQRPKLDAYDDYNFFVLHALNKKTKAAEEVDVFVGKHFVVTVHAHPSPVLDRLWDQVKGGGSLKGGGSAMLFYRIVDQLVDAYFPILYWMEDRLDQIEDSVNDMSYGSLIDEVFDIRNQLLHLRRTIVPMRDLLYRMLHLERLSHVHLHKAYFRDIHDHLLKLTELLDASREMTSDMRDSYQTISSNRMNQIMMTLTIVSTIFIPLTFIAGVYGMNFANMPELQTNYGYFVTLAVMVVIVLVMLWRFKKKGWFDIFK
ncbi:magnesium/cobalt transporter CorA [Bacillaceae bacterium SIJ1]|uniref:magnesium/cobalt transporter CorA n=1 Tax=Litoribacterium kuwaitense TaxID=1398745 RepID=UPI0013EC509C|nr:magnesium/cobalt transporter CorA [Litoribacterium kuwaitense]NGP44624.1 magnesium/cobalt transporter CorA [Litoribacterium kuwaitense]